MEIDEGMIDWTEQDPYILLDDIAALTDTEEALEIAREEANAEHEDTALESLYRKTQSFAGIRQSPPKEKDSLVETVHKQAQSLAGLDMKLFKEDADRDPVIKKMHKQIQNLAGMKK